MRTLDQDWTKLKKAEPNDEVGRNWAEGGVRARIGPSVRVRCLRGRCCVGSQRSVNSGDVMQARWRKGEPVFHLLGFGA